MTSDPRVAWVITRLNVGGPARHALHLVPALRARGYRVDLLSGTEGDDEGRLSSDGVVPIDVPHLQRKLSPLHELSAARNLVRWMKDAQPDIVHTHESKAGALGRIAARRSGVPIIIHTFHGHVLNGYFSPTGTKAVAAVERRLAKYADALVAVSAEVRDELLDMGIGRKDQWRVIELGIDLAKIRGRTITREEARERLGLSAKSLIVGSVGRLVPIKNMNLFLDAAERVSRVRPDTTFVIAGDGSERTELEERATSRLGDRVRFLGWVEDLPALYAALDVVVLTSLNEGTPTALLEAGAAARPVVATRVGGVPDIVRDGITGTLVPSGDAESVSGALIDLLEDRARRTSLGLEGRIWVSKRFTGERVLEDMDHLYAELLQRKGLASPSPKREMC